MNTQKIIVASCVLLGLSVTTVYAQSDESSGWSKRTGHHHTMSHKRVAAPAAQDPSTLAWPKPDEVPSVFGKAGAGTGY